MLNCWSAFCYTNVPTEVNTSVQIQWIISERSPKAQIYLVSGKFISIKHNSHSPLHLSLRTITLGHAFSILPTKICSISKTFFIVSVTNSFQWKIYFYSYKSKFNSHMFWGSLFLFSFNLSFYHRVLSFILGVSRKGVEQKRQWFISIFIRSIHKEQHTSRKTNSFTRTYF